MSTAMNFGSKSFKPKPPDKGAFPLDHFGECKAFKEKFMNCLRENSFENALCRQESKEYLECRMESHGKQLRNHFLKKSKEKGYKKADVLRKPNSHPIFGGLLCDNNPRQLMAREPLEKLGFKDLPGENSKTKHEKLQ